MTQGTGSAMRSWTPRFALALLAGFALALAGCSGETPTEPALSPSVVDAPGLAIDSHVGAIDGVVFRDDNQNGVRDAGEEGLEGLTVTLGTPGGSTLNTVTGSGGEYLFEELIPGFYTVTAPQPEGWMLTTPENVQVQVLAGEISTLDHGLYTEGDGPFGSITGTVFEDSNENGMLDDGEMGLADVEVRMTGPNGLNGVGTTTADGGYIFSVPEDGEYTVFVPEVEGYTFTTESSVTQSLTVADDVVVDFGLVMEEEPVEGDTIGGMIYEDLNGNGMYDEGEPGIAGVEVRLSSRNNPRDGDTRPGFGIHRYAVSDAEGHYVFEDVGPGDWRVFPRQPQGYHRSSDKDLTVSVMDGDLVDDADFGFVPRRGR